MPTGFAYAFTCSKLRPDELGGGYVIVTQDDVLFRSTSHMLDRELQHAVSEDDRPLVLTTRDAEDGLLFWNNETGFGRLADATVFTPREAANAPAVIAADEPEWLTAPRWSL
ncbi:hypothetical protein [Croceicoccus mobilis]|nr:hypothetical protein [Croceicoccus mobilis]